jgi:hypothetical protein
MGIGHDALSRERVRKKRIVINDLGPQSFVWRLRRGCKRGLSAGSPEERHLQTTASRMAR